MHTTRFFPRALPLLTVVAIFLLALVLACLTPMHSDDFFYALTGLSIDAHLTHYYNWSGRLLSDYTSSLLLLVDAPFVRAAISAAATSLFIYTVATIPPQPLPPRLQSFQIFFIFLAYWATNSSLGQTTFWIVGSANYLWMSCLIALYIKYLLRYCLQPTAARLALIAPLALFAGCTMENAAVFLPLIMLAIAWHTHRQGKRIPRGFIVLFVLTCAGLAVLLLAPGNARRAMIEGGEWYGMPFAKRLTVHLSRRFSPALGRSYPSLIVVAVCTFLLLRHKKSHIAALYFPALFFFCAIGSFFIMLAAPFFVARARMGGVLFFLISIAFLLPQMAELPRASRRALSALTVALALFFSASYLAMFVSYRNAMVQDAIRTDMILTARQSGIQQLVIPRHYFGFVMRGGDKFSQYHNDSIARYYGLPHITATDVFFDYSMLRNGYAFTPPQPPPLAGGMRVTRLYSKTEFPRTSTVIAIELSGHLMVETPAEAISLEARDRAGRALKPQGAVMPPVLIGDKLYIYRHFTTTDPAIIETVALTLNGEKLTLPDIRFAILR